MATCGLFIVFLTIPHVTYDVQRININGFLQYAVCLTDECTNTASEILAKLNTLIDPCDNFYKFACDNWVKNNRANETWPHVSIIVETLRKTKTQIRELLEESAKENDSKSLLKAKQLYAQCMDNEDGNAIKQINFSAIVNRYVEWPLTMSHHEWDKKNLTWQNVSNILHENGFNNGLFDITVGEITDSKAIFIKHPRIHLNQNIVSFFNITYKRLNIYAYVIDIENIAKKFIKENGGTDKIESIVKDASNIMLFGEELSTLINIANKQGDISDVLLTIQQLQEKYDKQHPGTQGKIDWYQAIQKVFASEEIAIEPSEKIVVEKGYKYFTGLVSLLERTPSRTIINYMLWTVISDFFGYIKYEENDAKWVTCVKYNLKFVLLHEYVKKLPDTIIQNFGEIFTDVKNIIREQIKKSTWMDKPTKKVCLEKLADMSYTIKPEWYNDEAIDKLYEIVNVSTTYIENLISLFKFNKRKMLRLLRSSPDEVLSFNDKFFSIPAFYNILKNRLDISPLFFPSLFYTKNNLSFINYALLGVFIGHEISYAETNVFEYDKYGNKRILWSPKAINNYVKITQCFIDQYDNYLVPGLEHMNVHVDGEWTVDESICDFAGIVAAYYAYKNRKARFSEPEWRLPGLEQYSNDQIFFLLYAQTMCEDVLPGAYEKWGDEQSSNDIRIRGSFSNFPEFSAAYNCPVGSVMNPVKKCVLW